MPNDTPLDLGLADPSDDETDRQLKGALQELVDGEAEAAAIAKRISTLVVSDCERDYEAHRASLSNSPPKDDENNNKTACKPFSSPVGWIAYLWRTIGQAAIAIPHSHSGQDRLVSLLQELWRLPPQTIHYISGDDVEEEYTFWESDENDQFCQNMRLLDSDANPTNPAKYVNFSAFLARVFARGLVDTTRFCALITGEFLGLRWPYNKRPEKGEPHVLAAAQWVAHAGPALWEMCEKKAYAAKGFNPTWWARWRDRFGQVAADDSGFGGQARGAAAEALRQMATFEEGEGSLVGLSVVEAFGLNVKDWED
ncbi:hypothetical protein PG987_010368 [Apiospora arundinis]